MSNLNATMPPVKKISLRDRNTVRLSPDAHAAARSELDQIAARERRYAEIDARDEADRLAKKEAARRAEAEARARIPISPKAPEPTSNNTTRLFVRIGETQYTLRIVPTTADTIFRLTKETGEIYTVAHSSKYAPTCDCPAFSADRTEDCIHVRALRAHRLI